MPYYLLSIRDRQFNGVAMKTLGKVAAVLLPAMLLAACASSPWETINIPINAKGWKLGYAPKPTQQGWIKEYVRPPQTVDNWTKLITLEFLNGNTTPPKEFMGELEARMRKRCPGVQWQIIEAQKTRVIYEWKIDDCSGQQNQNEIAELLRGDYGLYRAAYTEKVPSIDPATRKQWIQWLSQAKIIKEP